MRLNVKQNSRFFILFSKQAFGSAAAARKICCDNVAINKSNCSRKKYKLVIAGGGTGGASAANKFASELGEGSVAVVEPSNKHYYQPLWTLVGGGLKSFDQTGADMKDVLPKEADWIKEKVGKFDPDQNRIVLESGEEINYEYLICATGFQLQFDMIKGLTNALEEDPRVCSNYSPKYVKKTFPALKNFKEGNVLFTFPNSPIKCAGAPQKIMYLAEEYLNNSGKRAKANITFHTSLKVIFGVEKYAKALLKIINKRNINVVYRNNLVEVDHNNSEAIFENLDTQEKKFVKYSFLHAVPPMTAICAIKNSPLADANGFVNVSKETLQHVKYPNVFSLGDTSSLPTSKTAAAIASQIGVLSKNLRAVMKNEKPYATYDGYTSCPLVTSHNKCILAEFDYNGQPLETFPIDQGKERHTMFYMKAYGMPFMYWNMLLKGYWHGPKVVRKILHLGMGK